MEYGFNQETYLAHHGVKGQKWGVRRYQNPDGSLTNKGKARYSKDLYKSIKRYDDNSAMNQIRNDKRVKEYIKKGKQDSEKTVKLKRKVTELEKAIDKREDYLIGIANKKADKLGLDPGSDEYEKMVINTISFDKKSAKLYKDLKRAEVQIIKESSVKPDRSKERNALAKDLIGKYSDKPMMSLSTIDNDGHTQDIILTGTAFTEMLIKQAEDEK